MVSVWRCGRQAECGNQAKIGGRADRRSGRAGGGSRQSREDFADKSNPRSKTLSEQEIRAAERRISASRLTVVTTVGPGATERSLRSFRA